MSKNKKNIMQNTQAVIELLHTSDISVSQILEQYNCTYHFFRKAILQHLSNMEYHNIIHKRAGVVLRAARIKNKTTKITAIPENKCSRQKLDEIHEAEIAEFQLLQFSKKIKQWLCNCCGESYPNKPELCGKCNGSKFEQIEIPKIEAA